MGTATHFVYDGGAKALLARPDIAILFAFRISGIPYFFAAGPLPERWDLGGDEPFLWDGDDYGWLNRFIVSDLDGVSQKVEPKSGLGSSSSMTLRLWTLGTEATEEDPILSMLVRDLTRTDEWAGNLAAAIPADAVGPATITVSDTTGFAGGRLYVGIETISVVVPSGTQFTIGQRGYYGSWPQRHDYHPPGIYHGNAPTGAFVASWPLVWEGRAVEVFAFFGQCVDGEFVPFETTGGAQVYRQIFTGVLSWIEEDGAEVSLDVAGIEQVLATPVPIQTPHGEIQKFAPGQGDYFTLCKTTAALCWEWTKAAEVLQGIYLPDPTYQTQRTPAQISLLVAASIDSTAVTVPQPPPGGASIDGVTFFYGTDGVLRMLVVVFGDTSTYRLRFLPEIQGHGSVLQHLGFQQIAEASGAYSAGTNITAYEFAADSKPLALWLPARWRMGSTVDNLVMDLWLMPSPAQADPAFDATPGWATDSGIASPALVRVGKWGLAALTAVADGGQGRVQLTITAQTYTSLKLWGDEDLKIAVGDDTPAVEVVQGIAITNATLGRILLYLLIGGSGVPGTLHATYDQGWYGAGLSLPARLFNVTEMVQVGKLAEGRDLVYLDSPTELRKMVADELRIAQLMLAAVPDWSAGTAPQITLLPTYAPGETGEDSIYVDGSVLLSLGGGSVKIDRQEANIINEVAIEMGYDHASGKYRYQIQQEHLTSSETWGRRPTAKMRIQSIRPGNSVDAISEVARRFADRFFDRFAYPYEVITFSTGTPKSWAWRPGQVINLVSGVLPGLSDGYRGIDVMARIYAKKDNFVGGVVASTVTAVARASLGGRRSIWSPAILLGANDDVAVRFYHEHGFSDSTDPSDIVWFEAGDAVTVYARGTSTSIDTTIVAIIPGGPGAGTIEFADNIQPPSYPDDETVCVFRSYSSLTARQKKFVAWSKGLGVLSADAAYKYQAG